MKTINIYSVKELSEKALKKAYNDYLSTLKPNLDNEIYSVKSFCSIFNDANVTDWVLNNSNDSYINTDADQSNFIGVKRTDIPNVPDDDEYGLTGYHLDITLLYEFHDYMNKHDDIEGAFNAAIDAAVSTILKDLEIQKSLEYFCEISEMIDYYYLEDGSQLLKNWDFLKS